MKVSYSSLLQAMAEFDHALRETDQWSQWAENKAHKYAIRHEGRLYPVKHIVSLASGVPVRVFNGGKSSGHANGVAQTAGFEIVPLRGTNPDWTSDEHILALNLYLKTRPNPPGKDSDQIVQLSRILNRIGDRLFPPEERSKTFRNPNGIYMKMMNFRRFDPQYTESGKVGLSRGSGGEEGVWKEFSVDPSKCEAVAAAIVASLERPECRTILIDPDEDDGIQEAPEGRILTRMHVARERNRQLVKSKIKHALKKHQKLNCEGCGFDFEAKYGIRGHGFIECHHTKPVSSLAENGKTNIKDLALVCSNCHRMIHRTKHWLAIDQLRKLIAG